MSVKGVLIGMREKISRGWTQGAFARDKDGYANLEPANVNAVSWCIRGAVYSLQLDWLDTKVVLDDMARAAGLSNRLQLTAWNDAPERTQTEVLSLIDKVISEC